MANDLAVLQKDITDSVSRRVAELEDEGMQLPANYDYSSALKSAFFKLQKTENRQKQPVLQACTQTSIANALLDMVIQGLSPRKTQCYFVAYGSELELQRSYFGTQAVVKRLSEVDDIWANVIYDGDEFEMEIDKKGRERLVNHKTSFLNHDNDIIGVYAIVETPDNGELLTVMTMKEVQASWSQSKGGQHVHKKFPQEMAKRTVINRAAKNIINTSDDSDLLVDAINRTTENENDYDNERIDVTETAKTNDLLGDFKKQQAEKTVDKHVEKAKEESQDAEYSEVEETTEKPTYASGVDWDVYTIPQIKASLDKNNVEYSSNAKKAELIELAEEFMLMKQEFENNQEEQETQEGKETVETKTVQTVEGEKELPADLVDAMFEETEETEEKQPEDNAQQESEAVDLFGGNIGDYYEHN
ncbi:recombinase RecT [Aerococcus viridans]|uniref:recombinase RecT n=1 Tax=Aerococcus viridans TaxID=1377 RepID=UPI003AA808B4